MDAPPTTPPPSLAAVLPVSIGRNRSAEHLDAAGDTGFAALMSEVAPPLTEQGGRFVAVVQGEAAQMPLPEDRGDFRAMRVDGVPTMPNPSGGPVSDAIGTGPEAGTEPETGAAPIGATLPKGRSDASLLQTPHETRVRDAPGKQNGKAMGDDGPGSVMAGGDASLVSRVRQSHPADAAGGEGDMVRTETDARLGEASRQALQSAPGTAPDAARGLSGPGYMPAGATGKSVPFVSPVPNIANAAPGEMAGDAAPSSYRRDVPAAFVAAVPVRASEALQPTETAGSPQPGLPRETGPSARGPATDPFQPPRAARQVETVAHRDAPPDIPRSAVSIVAPAATWQSGPAADARALAQGQPGLAGVLADTLSPIATRAVEAAEAIPRPAQTTEPVPRAQTVLSTVPQADAKMPAPAAVTTQTAAVTRAPSEGAGIAGAPAASQPGPISGPISGPQTGTVRPETLAEARAPVDGAERRRDNRDAPVIRMGSDRSLRPGPAGQGASGPVAWLTAAKGAMPGRPETPVALSPASEPGAKIGLDPALAGAAAPPSALSASAGGAHAQPFGTPAGPGTSVAHHIAQHIVSNLPKPVSEIGNGVLELALDPPELGRVRMSLVELGGTLTLSITAERPDTAELMRRHMDILNQEFSRSGLDTPQVRVGTGSEGQGGPPDRQAGAGAMPSDDPRDADSGSDFSVRGAPHGASVDPDRALDLRL